MKYKLVDVINEVEEDVQFGTCDLCIMFMSHEYDVIVVEDENGNEIEGEMGFWVYGDYIDFGVDNYVDFAAWLSKKDILGKFRAGSLVEMYEEEMRQNEVNGIYGDYREETIDLT